MSEKTSQLDECASRLRDEYRQYYQTVLLVLAIRKYVEDNGKGHVEFGSVEPKIQTELGELSPDATLLYDGKRKGIAIEIKSSITDHQLGAEAKIKATARYDGDLQGWATPSRKVDEHSIALVAQLQDSRRIVDLYQGLEKRGEIHFTRSFSIWEFAFTESTKIGAGGEVAVVRNQMGLTGCAWLDEQLHEGFTVPTDDLIEIYEHCKFIRKRPPVIYTMQVLWTDVFQHLCNTQKESTDVRLDSIVRTCQDYYASWHGIQGKKTQIRVPWVRDALQSFCEIGLAEPIETGEKSFRIHYGKAIPKDILEYMIERMCSEEKGREEPRAKTTETLERFFGKD